MLQVHRQFRQIDIFVGQYDLMNRRIACVDFDDLLRRFQPAVHFPQQILGRDAKGSRYAAAATCHATYYLGALGPSPAEKNRLFVALHPRGNIGKIDWLLNDLYLTFVDHVVNEAAEPETIEVW
tara:strand:- start:429 stop:800 length:372 start_codon:yes stop_codon:yes gene_type:complete